MAALRERPIFALPDRVYAWDDLVLAACLWGRWAELEAQARTGLACLARLDDEEVDDELDEDDVSRAAAEFRYARDLEAAEDMEAWLEARSLDADQWLDAIRRQLLREQWAEDLESIEEEYEVDDGEVRDTLAAEVICTGAAAEIATRLAAQAAVAARSREEGAPEPTADELAAALGAVDGDQVARALPELGPAERGPRLEHLARLSLLAARAARDAVTDAAVDGELRARSLDWLRFGVRGLVVDGEAAAREAALCVRADGMDPAEVAAAAGAELLEEEWYLEEAPAPLRDRLLGARPGDVVGPAEIDGRYTVVRVESKSVPSPTDAAARARAADAVVARAASREMDQRVKWLLMP